jgi:hypothetical protein
MRWRRVSAAVGLVLLVSVSAAATGSTVSLAIEATPGPGCSEVPAAPAPMAALKPSDVLLAINSPRAGETVLASDGVMAVSVDYWGPRLVRAEEARAVDDYHLAFFLDADPAPFVGSLLPTPRCHPRVLHSTAPRVSFPDVTSGSHALAVLLVGSNHVSVNPPVATRVTFMVK